MKQKEKSFIVIILAAIPIVILLLLLSHNNSGGSNLEEKRKKTEGNQEKVSEKPLLPPSPKLRISKHDSGFDKYRPTDISDKNWERFKKSIKGYWQEIKDIDYYCMVLDQYNNPIEGVIVNFKVSKFSDNLAKLLSKDTRSPWEHSYVNVESNNKGIVHLNGVRGARFSIAKLVKNNYSEEKINASYSFEAGRKESLPQSSLDKPVKLYMIEHNASEPLYKTSFYTDLAYGKPWSMDLFGISVAQKNIIRENAMTISCRQTKENYNIRDWEMTIKPIKGHAVSLTDRHTYVASGLSSDKLTIRNEDLNYKGHFYLFYHNIEKDYYSKIRMEIGGARDGVRINATTFSNPIKGSKNLAYLKEKRLRRWPGVIDPSEK